VTGVAAFFQSTNFFGLDPWLYTLLVLAALVALEQSFDNLVTPRVLGRTLDLHPAAILIGALILQPDRDRGAGAGGARPGKY
jgi:predicted PurR-regulated permease PerM